MDTAFAAQGDVSGFAGSRGAHLKNIASAGRSAAAQRNIEPAKGHVGRRLSDR